MQECPENGSFLDMLKIPILGYRNHNYPVNIAVSFSTSRLCQ